jgi:hypothetical protein
MNSTASTDGARGKVPEPEPSRVLNKKLFASFTPELVMPCRLESGRAHQIQERHPAPSPTTKNTGQGILSYSSPAQQHWNHVSICPVTEKSPAKRIADAIAMSFASRLPSTSTISGARRE